MVKDSFAVVSISEPRLVPCGVGSCSEVVMLSPEKLGGSSLSVFAKAGLSCVSAWLHMGSHSSLFNTDPVSYSVICLSVKST